jgi:hypothetical protein
MKIGHFDHNELFNPIDVGDNQMTTCSLTLPSLEALSCHVGDGQLDRGVSGTTFGTYEVVCKCIVPTKRYWLGCFYVRSDWSRNSAGVASANPETMPSDQERSQISQVQRSEADNSTLRPYLFLKMVTSINGVLCTLTLREFDNQGNPATPCACDRCSKQERSISGHPSDPTYLGLLSTNDVTVRIRLGQNNLRGLLLKT